MLRLKSQLNMMETISHKRVDTVVISTQTDAEVSNEEIRRAMIDLSHQGSYSGQVPGRKD